MFEIEKTQTEILYRIHFDPFCIKQGIYNHPHWGKAFQTPCGQSSETQSSKPLQMSSIVNQKVGSK